MNIKIITLLVLLSITLSSTLAQNKKPVSKHTVKKPETVQQESKEKGVLFFDFTSFNFDKINEENGRKFVDFPFTNIGKGDVKILSIVTGCGCTSAEWDKGRVYKQGEKDHLTLYFNPKNLDGYFSRTVVVQTDGDPAVTNLTIQGDVYGPTHNLTIEYPFEIGKSRFSHNVLQFPHVKKNKNDSILLKIYNGTDKRIQILGIKAPDYIKTKIYFTYIEPKNYSAVMLTILSENIKSYGPIEDKITINTSEADVPLKKFLLKANIEEDFTNMTPEMKKNPPKIFFKEMSKDFGEVYYGEVVEYDFEVMNKGKSDLYIRSAYGSCGCTVASFSPEPIKKGKKGKVTVRFDAKNLRGIQTKNITVISNDPNNSISTLTIKATMVEDGMKKK